MPLAESLASYMPARINAPGEHTAYSNWATALAGLIVANVSGVEFNQYIQNNIFDVLGMKHATFVEPLPPELDQHMAKGYGWKAGAYFEKNYEIISNFGPAGAMATSGLEMTKFAKAILNNGALVDADGNEHRILQPETMQQVLSPLFKHDPRTRGMAYGFMEYPYNGVDVIGHNGATQLYLSHFGLSQEHNLMLFFSFSGPGRGAVYRVLPKAFYDYFFPSEQPYITPPSDFAERAASFAGTYQSWRSDFTKIEKMMGLLGGVKVTPTADNTLLIGKARYVEEAKNLFRQVDGDKRIVFQQNDNGEITGYINDGLAAVQMYKAPFHATFSFVLLLVPSLIVFAAVMLRRAYQGVAYKALPAPEKNAFRASLAVAGSNWLFLLLFVVPLLTMSDLAYAIPGVVKFSLIFPIIALLAALYHLYQSVQVWRGGMGASVWARIRFSIVTLCGLGTAWVYYSLNLIGFNYFS